MYGITCPTDPFEADACAKKCDAEASCKVGCYESLPDATQSNLDLVLECQIENCLGLQTSEFQVCQIENCGELLGKCYFDGELGCADVFFDCYPSCPPGDQSCLLECNEQLSPSGWVDSALWGLCRSSYCDLNQDNEPDTDVCGILAGFSACYTPESTCHDPISGIGGGMVDCGDHHQCIRACLDTLAFNPGCPYGCLQSVSQEAQILSAPLTACVLSVCGPFVDGDCYDSAVNSVCYPEAAACGFPVGPEVCTGGEDDDGNGLVDCEDPACALLQVCTLPPESESNCSDGLDEDGDSLVDCDDLDCIGVDGCSVLPDGTRLVIIDGMDSCTPELDTGSPGFEVDAVLLTKTNGFSTSAVSAVLFEGGLCSQNDFASTASVVGAPDGVFVALNGNKARIDFGPGVQFAPGDSFKVVEGGSDGQEGYGVGLNVPGTGSFVLLGFGSGTQEFEITPALSE